MSKKLDSVTIYNDLKLLFQNYHLGTINFNLCNINVKINSTDIVGNSLQSWLKEYFIYHNIFFLEPHNTQEFPDFFLSNFSDKNLLEVKSFIYSRNPAFDIANFESYCDSVKNKPYRLDADYLIFGYEMSEDGNITIKDLWLKKIWEIAGTSSRYALKTQIKRDVIYNIRPNSQFKNNNKTPFSSKKDFIVALYQTLFEYRGQEFADNWYNTFKSNFKKYYNYDF